MSTSLLKNLAFSVSERLLANGQKLATAESCTGGMVAQYLTTIPGSSGWFERGFITYSNESKTEMLGVSPQIINTQGAVSEQVAAHMAKGALMNSHADWTLSITGIAGPTGGSIEKPVGTVCFGWSQRGGITETQTFVFSGDRDEIRLQASIHALQGLLDRSASSLA